MSSPASAERPPTLLEAALQLDRLPLIVLLLLVPLIAWLWIIAMARDMYGPMTGPAAWMMTPTWDASHLALLWAMWAVMMLAMMLPTAAPLIVLYGAAARRSAAGVGANYTSYALAAGYVAVWGAFSLAATVLQRLLANRLLLSPMMEASSTRVSGALLVLAGVYQWMPLKRVCLHACRAPLAFLMSRWRGGTRGAFRMGVEHGAVCVGCCWALMLLLFAAGVMNLAVIAGLTLLVALEKLGPAGPAVSRLTGVVLIGAGVWIALA